MNILGNIFSCRWYRIYKSHGFTIQGQSINASSAFRLYEKKFDVKYRDVSISDIFENIYQAEIDTTAYYLVCGYIEDKDVFVTLKYTVEKIRNNRNMKTI